MMIALYWTLDHCFIVSLRHFHFRKSWCFVLVNIQKLILFLYFRYLLRLVILFQRVLKCFCLIIYTIIFEILNMLFLIFMEAYMRLVDIFKKNAIKPKCLTEMFYVNYFCI